jgi:hypothetical protein
MTWVLRTPVALLVFARPAHTRRVIAEILKVRPPQVLVFGDAPRPGHPDDAARVAAVRAVVAEAPWECEVLTNYSAVNLGTRYRPATGLDWVFENVEQAIFLEDDCLPHSTFWRFCDELLDRYRDDERVMMVSGDNFMPRRSATDSYLFTRGVGLWGWATWRRAWRHYDVDLNQWPKLRETSFLRDVLADEGDVKLWRRRFDRVISGKSVTWDFQWQFACWAKNGLSIMPAVNLCSNIGFGPEATSLRDPTHKLANFPTAAMTFPLSHPPVMAPSREADDFFFQLHRELSSPAATLAGVVHELRRRLRARRKPR